MEVANGLRSILASAKVYELFKVVIGSDKGTRTFVDRFVRPRQGDRVLDIGCGPAGVLRYLGDVEYVGFDASQRYIAEATRTYGPRGRFVCERLTADTAATCDGFDIVLAQGVLHHLNDDEAIALFALARAALKPDGRLVTIDGCFCGSQSVVAKYLLSHDRGQNVRSEPEYLALAREVFRDVRATIETGLLRIPYTHIIMEARQGS